MIAYDCNGKVLNVGDEAIKINADIKTNFIGKSITVIDSLKYYHNEAFIYKAGLYVEIKYHDGSVHNKTTGISLTEPYKLMKITPDADIKEDESELVLVNH